MCRVGRLEGKAPRRKPFAFHFIVIDPSDGGVGGMGLDIWIYLGGGPVVAHAPLQHGAHAGGELLLCVFDR